MSGYADLVAQDLRLTLLRLLAEASGHSANSSVLQRAAEAFGFVLPRERIESELDYLARLDAVVTERLGSVVVARLRQRGLDHIEYRAVLAGVKVPALD